jgi:hypothetical protein
VDGTLTGGGTVGTVTVTNGGRLAPGSSTSRLSTGNIVLNAGSIFDIHVNQVPGYDMEQLVVAGTVNLGDATLQASAGYFQSNQVFKIIDNDGTDSVTGTFSGLPEGATVSLNGSIFTISYVGGDGNDVTLTAPTVAGPQAPVVTSVVLDEGTGGIINGIDGTKQRSEVRRIRVTFSESVTFSGAVANAFSLNRSATSLATPAGGTGTVSIVANPATGPASSVTLTFGAGTFVDATASLQDGIYNFSIVASQVSGAAGNLNGSGYGAGSNYSIAGSYANKWFRFYGDYNADGNVDQVDYLKFRDALAGGPNRIFDFDNNGEVDQVDYLRFKQNISG